MVGNSVQGCLGHGVHGVGCNQAGDVQGVRQGRVLHTGGCPQRALYVRAVCLQTCPTLGGEHFLEHLVGEACVCQACLALELHSVAAGSFEACIDFGVYAGDEEGCDRVDGGQVLTVLQRLLQAEHVGVDDLAVAGQGEDQGHVHADASSQGLRDGAQAFLGCGDLDHDVFAAHALVEFTCHLGGAFGVACQAGVNLDGDAAVKTVGCLVDGCEHVAGCAHVVAGCGEDCLFNACAGGGKLTHLLSVCGALGERASEDGGVGGHTDDVVGLDEFGEVAAGQTLTGEVVKPDGDAGVGKLLSGLRHVKTFDSLSKLKFEISVKSSGRREAPAERSAGAYPLRPHPTRTGGSAVCAAVTAALLLPT